MKAVQLIVEGDGDVRAVPTLVRRILQEHGIYDVRLPEPHKRGELSKVKRRFRDFLETAILEGHPVLCVLDFDCQDCIDVLAEEKALMSEAQHIRPGYPFFACFIVKEYESLFLTDTQCIKQGLGQVRTDYNFPLTPESVRDAKGEISKALHSGWAYKPTVHQEKLSSLVDLSLLRQKSPSFNRLEQAVLALVKL